MRIRFGDCVVDPGSRQLTRNGRAVDLTPKAFDLLHALLEKRPNVVKRAELHDLLWPHAFVASTSLPRLVTELRKALGENRKSKLIRTVYGFGYAFSGETSNETEAPARSGCSVVWGDRAIPLVEGENLIGRAGECTVVIASSRVSRHHARIVVTGSDAVIEDLKSKNGTLVQGVRIEARVPLAGGDEITIGPAILIFRSPGAGGSTVSGAGRT